jgi:hypothetical protein
VAKSYLLDSQSLDRTAVSRYRSFYVLSAVCYCTTTRGGKMAQPILRKLIASLLLLIYLSFLGIAGLNRPSLVKADVAAQAIYTDNLAAGWSDWSWATVNLLATAPVHSGSHTIAVTYGAWQGLYLHSPEVSTLGFTHLRFYIHGGSQGGQHVNVYMIRIVGSQEVEGPAVSLPLPSANSWNEVQVALADLDAENTSITGIVWQGATNGGQPTVYLDDISLTSAESPDGPSLTEEEIWPRAVPADGSTDLAVRVKISDPQGLVDIASVTLEASAVGWGSLAMYDDGRNHDGPAGDGVYGRILTVSTGTPVGEKVLLISAQDQSGHIATLQLGSLVVLAPPGGQPPAALPGRIGWGSNTWSETPGADWQVNSGVPWDYVYQYITYEWYRDGWGGNFVGRFVQQAWNKHFIPMVTVYMVLALPPTCGEGPACYAQKLQNPTAVQTYLAALTEAARQAQGTHPVVFNLEPDFYGYMQQYSNSAGRPSGVQPDDPSSYPVALNITGYPNTLVGFGRRMVDVVHATAPNALVAPMASMWATNGDPQAVTSSEAMAMGQRTAAFIDTMGGSQADLLVVEWSDRDAGSGLRPWWDASDRIPPRPTRAILWENALSQAAHKRLFLWQMPVGNMALDNTCDHYQDNRADYAFRHPRDLFDAGVIGVLFGGGADCMTQVDSDGGFVAGQGAIAYNPPAAPSGLAVDAVNGALVSLHWSENSEPDLWGYRIVYQPAGGGQSWMVEAGRENALNFILPWSGSWQVQVLSYDAMGNLSLPSGPVMVSSTADAYLIQLPLLRR